MLCRVIWEQEDSDIVDFVYIDEDGCLELLDIENSAFEMLTKYLKKP
jgi:hypothetical protein